MPRNDYSSEERFDRKSGNDRSSKNWHEDEYPFYEERGFFKEQPKRRRCDEDYYPEKFCYPPCPDWYRCPPPWFWCKPENDEKKDCHKRDDCDRKDDCNKHKECCCELEAYAYVYSLTATAVTVLSNSDVLFTNNGPIEDVTHTPNSSQVFIRKSGVYQIYYGVNATAGAGASISLAVNGVIDPSTTLPISTTPSETSGKVLIRLRAGDFLTLRNSSTVPLTLAIAPFVGAQLTLERIDEISCRQDG